MPARSPDADCEASFPVLPVYILSGGRSIRFGSDKARAVLKGEPLIKRLAAAAQPIASSVTVVADVQDKYADLGLTTIADETPGLGPLGGLATALGHLQRRADSAQLLLLSCDMLVFRPQWAAMLASAAQAEPAAVIFDDGRWQPMPGIYHRRILPTARQLLSAGQRAMKQLLMDIGPMTLPVPADWPDRLQANRPEDLEPGA